MDSFPLILMKDIEYIYPNGTKALVKINLNVRKGEIIGIMGQNGAGKTTLLRTLNGLLRPTKGDVYLEGEKTRDKSIGSLSKKVGIMFQNPEHQLFSNTVEEEIKYSLKTIYNSKELIQEKTLEILRIFEFEKYKEKSPLNLSGGEKKKLALASIICRNPQILAFDEPTLGQDAKEIEFFVKLLNEEKKKGKTIIIITHNVEFEMEYIPRTILMAEGKILADGTTHQVLTNELLVEKSSLILPQCREFVNELNKGGIQVPLEIYLKHEIKNYIKNNLLEKITKN